MDEADVERVAYECALLTQRGWQRRADQRWDRKWSHPRLPIGQLLARGEAVGKQALWDAEQRRRESSQTRLPATPPPMPADDVPTKPGG